MWRVIYRDNGMSLFKEIEKILDINIWRDDPQNKVNEISSNRYLQLNCEV